MLILFSSGSQGAGRVPGSDVTGAGVTVGVDRESDVEVQANQFINGSDVMISSRSQSDSLLRRTAREVVGELDSEDLSAAAKRPRLDTSVSAL